MAAIPFPWTDMDHSGREDRKLSEVKAVLHRLQGLSTEPEPAGLRSAEPDSHRARRPGITTGVIVAAAAVVLVAAYAFPKLRDPVPTKTATESRPAADASGPGAQAATMNPQAPNNALGTQPTTPATSPVVRPALEAALALMASGRIRAARRQLLPMAGDGSPDVAWALARSYDPNYLAAIPAADAGPNVEEAIRWYQTWYAAAVKQGLVADSVSLNRIIGSMQR